MTDNPIRILITGAYGQLGKSIKQIIDRDLSGIEATYTDIDSLDLTNPETVDSKLKEGNFDIIVNCAAYTAVDRAESDEVSCSKINTEAVGHIAKAARRNKVKVIHISTDYVFNGENFRPYDENDEPDPRSIYGRTKLEGEGILMSFCPDSIIIRTAWLYSEYGNNFVKTMLRLGTEKDSIGVVCDQIGTPTYAGDLAATILQVILSDKWKPGIYHFTNEGVASWYDFAIAIHKLAHIDKCRITPLATKEYPTAARRPQYSVLSKKKIKNTFGIVIPHWEESLARCIDSMKIIDQQ